MRIVDLTLPLKDEMDYYCTGNLPWEVKFKTEYTVPKALNLDLASFTMYSEPGTRFLCHGPKKMDEVFKRELDKLVLKDAVLLRVPNKEPKEGGNLITEEEIKDAIQKCPARPGDAIILYTGMGDDEKYYKMAERWEPWSACLSPESLYPLADYLKEVECPLFGYDTPNFSWQCTDLCSMHTEWALRKPRPEPNSPEAREVATKYIESGRFKEEFKDLFIMTGQFDMLGCIVNCGEIKAERFKLIIGPLKVIDFGFVPATAYAIVE